MKRRYDEIMDRIEMTPAMKERLLEKLSSVSPEAPGERAPDGELPLERGRPTRPLWKRVLPIAAMLAVVLAGTLIWRIFGGTTITDPPVPTDGPGSQTAVGDPAGFEKYSSLTDLEKAVGFPVEELRALPFEADGVVYEASGTTARISAAGEGKSAVLRKAPAGRALSNAVFPEMRETEIDGISVVLGGADGRYSTAVWNRGEYAYCLELKDGEPEEIIAEIITQTLKGAGS